jgi:hypothetical protein
MTASTGIEVAGVKEAIRSLNKLEPGLRKQFVADAKQIVAPILEDARGRYPEQLLSGMERNWTQRGNKKFPYDANRARKGLKHKVDTSRKATSIIKAQQTDPAASIIEFAGKKTANPLGRSLDKFGRVSRFFWPAAERQLPKVQAELERAVLDAVRKVQKEL